MVFMSKVWFKQMVGDGEDIRGKKFGGEDIRVLEWEAALVVHQFKRLFQVEHDLKTGVDEL